MRRVRPRETQFQQGNTLRVLPSNACKFNYLIRDPYQGGPLRLRKGLLRVLLLLPHPLQFLNDFRRRLHPAIGIRRLGSWSSRRSRLFRRLNFRRSIIVVAVVVALVRLVVRLPAAPGPPPATAPPPWRAVSTISFGVPCSVTPTIRKLYPASCSIAGEHIPWIARAVSSKNALILLDSHLPKCRRTRPDAAGSPKDWNCRPGWSKARHSG